MGLSKYSYTYPSVGIITLSGSMWLPDSQGPSTSRGGGGVMAFRSID